MPDLDIIGFICSQPVAPPGLASNLCDVWPDLIPEARRALVTKLVADGAARDRQHAPPPPPPPPPPLQRSLTHPRSPAHDQAASAERQSQRRRPNNTEDGVPIDPALLNSEMDPNCKQKYYMHT
jgi:hypothetical protein